MPIGIMTAAALTVRNPFDGSTVGEVQQCSAADVDAAVAAARRALADEPLPAWRRAEICDATAAAISTQTDALADLIAREAAKPIRSARDEVARAASTFRFAAAEARKLSGEVVPLDASATGEGRLGYTMRLPVGVVGAISPFNFPLNLVAHKVAPAIAAGCPVVLKPASATPLSATALADVLLASGLPRNYLHVVPGSGGTVGTAIVDHPDIASITFTGSPDVGWDIRARAPRKRVSLELGNNAPVILAADADWESAVAKLPVAGYGHAGQSCISTQRLFVHDAIADEVIDALAAAVRELVLGDPLTEQTDLSALITTTERDRVRSWIDDAVGSGARVASGGRLRDGHLEPTLLTDVTPEMAVCRHEVFGPVIGVQRIRSTDDGIRLANDTRYGLQAAIFTRDLGRALSAARALDFGGVLVNEVPTWRADQQPYGGVRDSGNTREGPAYAVREMTDARFVMLHGSAPTD
jgi:acyl-CoA reductase-like NAD-dependent aldehyde dehydrogenase